MLVETVVTLLDGIADSLLSIVGLILYVNFQFVSLLLDVAGTVVDAISNIVTGICVALAEFTEQYGDWCYALLNLATSAFVHLLNGVIGLAALAKSGALFVWSGLCAIGIMIQSMFGVVLKVLAWPLKAMGLCWDGFVLFLSLVYRLIVWCGSTAYLCCAKCCEFGISIAEAIMKFWLELAARPFVVTKRIAIHMYETPTEAFYGLCIILFICFALHMGWIQHLYRFTLRQLRKLVLYLLYLLLELCHALLWVFAPQLALCVSIARSAYSWFQFTIGWFLDIARWLCGAGRSTDERLTCIICLDKERNVLLQPCGHICMCRTCVRRMRQQNNRQQKLCPVCRTEITNSVNVYL